MKSKLTTLLLLLTDVATDDVPVGLVMAGFVNVTIREASIVRSLRTALLINSFNNSARAK
jgi:hypothetical protein